MQKILACVEWDSTSNTCITQAWIDQPSVLPTLSVTDAQTIGYAIAFLWATAFVFKLVRRLLN